MRKNIIILILVIALFQFFPTDARAVLNSSEVEALLSDGKLDETETILNREGGSGSKDPVVLTLLGELYRQKGDRDGAVKFLNKAVSLDPAHPMPYFYLGKALFSMQKFDEAIEDFGIFMEKMRPLLNSGANKSYYTNKLHDICQICFGLKRYEEAKIALDEILRLDPKDQGGLYNMGVYYYLYERKRPAAYQYFTKTIEVDPNTHTAAKARYAIEFMRTNPDSRIEPDLDFVNQEYRYNF